MIGTENDIIVGLDVGTSNICAVVGKRTKNTIDIIGVGSCLSSGVKKGQVVNLLAAGNAISNAVSEAEQMSGCPIKSVVVGIGNKLAKSRNIAGMVSISNGEIKANDVRRVLDSARTIRLDSGIQILHSIPREFTVNKIENIVNPIGMRGKSLDAQVNIITAPSADITNLVGSCELAGLAVTGVIINSLAAAEAVLILQIL